MISVHDAGPTDEVRRVVLAVDMTCWLRPEVRICPERVEA